MKLHFIFMKKVHHKNIEKYYKPTDLLIFVPFQFAVLFIDFWINKCEIMKYRHKLANGYMIWNL